ncbi:WW domain-binding protein 11, putative [Plasmodium vivax]|nr:WW domain-binding protein 11, putative [Plasmodium vivax]
MKRSQMLKETLKKSKIPTDVYRKQQKKKEKKKKKQEWSEQLEKLVSTKNPHDVKEKLDALRTREQQGKLLHVEKKKLKQYETLWNLIKEKVKDGSYFYSNNGVVFSMSGQHGGDGADGGDAANSGDGEDNFPGEERLDGAPGGESDCASSDVEVSSESSDESDGSSSVQSGDVNSSQGDDLGGAPGGDHQEEEDFFLESLPSLPKGLPDEFIIPNVNAPPSVSGYPGISGYPSVGSYASYQPPVPFNATGQSSGFYAYSNNGYYGGYPNGVNFYFGSGYPAQYVHAGGSKSCLDRQGKKEKAIPTDDGQQNGKSEKSSKDSLPPRGEDHTDPSSSKLSSNAPNVSSKEGEFPPEGDSTLATVGTKDDVDASRDAHGDGPPVCANPKEDEGEKNSAHDGAGSHLNGAEIDCKAANGRGGTVPPPPPSVPPSDYPNSGTQNPFMAPSYGGNYYYNYAHMYGNFNAGQMNGGNCFTPTNSNMALWGAPNLRGGHGYAAPSRNYGDRGKRHTNPNRGRGGNPAPKKARMGAGGASGANYGFPTSQPDEYDQSGYGARGQGARRAHPRQRHREDRTMEPRHGQEGDLQRTAQPTAQPAEQYFVPINLRLKNKLNDLCETKINAVKKERSDSDKNINLDVEYSKFIKEVDLG